jgi:eukaryotic-like serine/threonine-protein kinase
MSEGPGGSSGQESGPTERPLPAPFGRYTPVRRLGTGGMGEVFLVRMRPDATREGIDDGSLAVMKRAHDDPSLARQFARECRLSRGLQHPNLLRVLEEGSLPDGARFLVLEHAAGADLRAVVRRMPERGFRAFPLDAAIAIAREVAAGLAYLHRVEIPGLAPAGVVHGDLSPANVVVTHRGAVKVVDLGLARAIGEIDAAERGRVAEGSVSYMSPEQAAGERLDPRSDLFSLGIVLYELTTGKRLYRGSTDHETLRLIQDRDVPAPSAVCPGYPPALEGLVLRMLARAPDRRPASAADVGTELDQFSRSERLGDSGPVLGPLMTRLFPVEVAELGRP